jgi:hypothetical protein
MNSKAHHSNCANMFSVTFVTLRCGSSWKRTVTSQFGICLLLAWTHIRGPPGAKCELSNLITSHGSKKRLAFVVEVRSVECWSIMWQQGGQERGLRWRKFPVLDIRMSLLSSCGTHQVTEHGAWKEFSFEHTIFTKLCIYMIYLLTAIGLSPGGSSTVHIYT